MQKANIKGFRRAVWRHYHAHGRHDLPWRRTRDPYRIMVSELMLQQTQVPRVLEKYREFLSAFPTVRALAAAPLADVLRVWSGLGYNRRGKFLREAAVAIIRDHHGRVPRDGVSLRTIPGIGPYTASAILVFAYNIPDTMIETNIRAAFIHHFFDDKKPVHDRDLLALIEAAAAGQDPREWHWALMDYGAHLKKLHGNPSRKSAHYVRQSKFEGSLRQVRGAILRELHKGPSTLKSQTFKSFEKERIESALAGLARDGLIIKQRGRWCVSK